MNLHQLHQEQHETEVCVIGGGMAGICAALASARNGAKTVLIHDRPVLGGNASSEVRMWICGARGKQNKETGLLEEIQLDNLYHNSALNYSIWDGMLWGKLKFQENLTLLLNASCLDAQMEGETIAQVTAWQLTSQTMHTVRARQFIDCSGDSILAALTPAQWRAGRESRHEYDEDIQPARADDKTMGNSLLIQMRRTDEPHTFVAPSWAYKFETPDDFPHRMKGVQGHNFWWIEVGGLDDTIKDAEAIRDELMRITYGVWDYIKNRAPEREKSANWALEWLGSLPGKRENRRYVGLHTLTQNEVRDEGKFDDIVAYGGWPMDDHHPAAIYYDGKPTIFHPAPSPYGIPFRSLVSANLPNLMFAGRNISVTHAALSSTRVMATCALLGQAAGTAASLCVRHEVAPRELSEGPLLRELQNILMDDDCWLPGRLRAPSDLACAAQLKGNPSVECLRDGLDRDRDDASHAWECETGESAEYHWPEPVIIKGARLVFDSNLPNDKRMPSSYPQKDSGPRVPSSLVKAFRLEALDEAGAWHLVYRETNNYQRLVRVELSEQTCALRLVPEATWGDEKCRVFGFEPMESWTPKQTPAPDGPTWSERVAQIAPADLAPYDTLETEQASGASRAA